MTPGLFVTGTDTGSGKTVVTAALAMGLTARGFRVAVMKPVETGCRHVGNRLIGDDAVALMQASGLNIPMELVNPYALPEPLAPAIAAERAGVEINIGQIVDGFQQLAAECDVVLVEGAGGLLVPLTDEVTMLDLARRLGLPLLVVARNVLGVINHTALTVSVARAHTVPVVGVVLNHVTHHEDLATSTNADALQRWAGAPLLGEIPYVPGLNADSIRVIGERFVTEEFVRTLFDPGPV